MLPWTVTGVYIITPAPIIVNDRDVENNIGPPDTLICEIRISDGAQFFDIAPGAPVFNTTPCDDLNVTGVIDVDLLPHYKQINLTLLVQDDSLAGDMIDLYITVTDINDNVPTFDFPTYSAEIEGWSYNQEVLFKTKIRYLNEVSYLMQHPYCFLI